MWCSDGVHSTQNQGKVQDQQGTCIYGQIQSFITFHAISIFLLEKVNKYHIIVKMMMYIEYCIYIEQ